MTGCRGSVIGGLVAVCSGYGHDLSCGKGRSMLIGTDCVQEHLGTCSLVEVPRSMS